VQAQTPVSDENPPGEIQTADGEGRGRRREERGERE
jgi:hypothetical protein